MTSKEQNARIIAVGGGKGGAGKSFLAANLALGVAERGNRVLLLDADLGGANLHTILGQPRPEKSLADFMTQDMDLDSLAIDTSYENLRLISGVLDDINLAYQDPKVRSKLLHHLVKLDADFVVIDLGGGTSLTTLDFFLMADHGIVVTHPEPTSVENVYRFLKAAYFRRLSRVASLYDIGDLVIDAQKHKNDLGIYTPADLLRELRRRDLEIYQEIEEVMASFRPELVVNEVRAEEEADKSFPEDMASACRRFFGVPLHLLGQIPHDPHVHKSIRARKPLLHYAPDCPATLAILLIIGALNRVHSGG